MLINITEEMIIDLKIAYRRLLEISEPYMDLEVFTLQSIIEEYEEGYEDWGNDEFI